MDYYYEKQIKHQLDLVSLSDLIRLKDLPLTGSTENSCRNVQLAKYNEEVIDLYILGHMKKDNIFATFLDFNKIVFFYYDEERLILMPFYIPESIQKDCYNVPNKINYNRLLELTSENKWIKTIEGLPNTLQMDIFIKKLNNTNVQNLEKVKEYLEGYLSLIFEKQGFSSNILPEGLISLIERTFKPDVKYLIKTQDFGDIYFPLGENNEVYFAFSDCDEAIIESIAITSGSIGAKSIATTSNIIAYTKINNGYKFLLKSINQSKTVVQESWKVVNGKIDFD